MLQQNRAKTIAVYESCQPNGTAPSRIVDLTTALAMVKGGEADFINRNKAMRMREVDSPRQERQVHRMRDVSAKPGSTRSKPEAGITNRYVEAVGTYISDCKPGADPRSLMIVAAWKPLVRAIG